MRWRSVLFVPGDRADLAAKAPRFEPDVVVLDLEDAVAAGAKEEARGIAHDAAQGLQDRGHVCIRVNPPGSPWHDGDVAALPDGLAAVVVPKWEVPIDINFPVVAGIETVRGIADAHDILGPHVTACYFGAEDFIADLAGVRTAGNLEVLHARSTVALAARLAGIPALDMVTLDYHDADRFNEEAAGARALGYAGKLCIHPAQVALANEAFVPTAGEIDRARRLLAAFEDAGSAAAVFEGQMVDEVVALQARTVLTAAGHRPESAQRPSGR